MPDWKSGEGKGGGKPSAGGKPAGGKKYGGASGKKSGSGQSGKKKTYFDGQNRWKNNYPGKDGAPAGGPAPKPGNDPKSKVLSSVKESVEDYAAGNVPEFDTGEKVTRRVLVMSEWAKSKPWYHRKGASLTFDFLAPDYVDPERVVDGKTGRFDAKAYDKEMSYRVSMIDSYHGAFFKYFSADRMASTFCDCRREVQLLMMSPEERPKNVACVDDGKPGSESVSKYIDEAVGEQMLALKRTMSDYRIYLPKGMPEEDLKARYDVLERQVMTQAITAELCGYATLSDKTKARFGTVPGPGGKPVSRYDMMKRLTEEKMVESGISLADLATDASRNAKPSVGLDRMDLHEIKKLAGVELDTSGGKKDGKSGSEKGAHGPAGGRTDSGSGFERDVPGDGKAEDSAESARPRSTYKGVDRFVYATGDVSAFAAGVLKWHNEEVLRRRQAEASAERRGQSRPGKSYHDAKAPDTSFIEGEPQHDICVDFG